MIFRQGEYVRYLCGENADCVARVGQINKVLDIDALDYPYEVVIVAADGATRIFLSCAKELQLLKRQEADIEIEGYMKKVKRR